MRFLSPARARMLRLVPVLSLLLATAASAQPTDRAPFDFGAADDPTEMPPRDIRPAGARFAAFGGPSYIGVAWRGGVGLEADLAAGPVSLGLGGPLRVGNGRYEEDFDETYDLLRLVRYARLDPTPRLPVYARVGPLEHLTLGTGDLVRSFRTTADWDERTVGAEAAVKLPFLRVMGFADDLRLGGIAEATRPGGVVAGRIELAPFEYALSPTLRAFEIGATAVTDRSLPADTATAAVGLDARLAVWGIGDFTLSPFASYARYLEHGDGFGGGVEFASRDLAGFGRLGATVGFVQSGAGFIPGHFNAFYSLSNPEAHIWQAEQFYENRQVFAAADTTALAEAAGGFSLTFALRALVFNAFELVAYARRDFSGDALSEGTLRLVFSPGSGDPFRFVFEMQRQGRAGFWNLFSELQDQNLLVFHLDYALPGPAWLTIRSRYGYGRERDGPGGERRYLVERRFEPFVGVRVVLQ